MVWICGYWSWFCYRNTLTYICLDLFFFFMYLIHVVYWWHDLICRMPKRDYIIVGYGIMSEIRPMGLLFEAVWVPLHDEHDYCNYLVKWHVCINHGAQLTWGWLACISGCFSSFVCVSHVCQQQLDGLAVEKYDYVWGQEKHASESNMSIMNRHKGWWPCVADDNTSVTTGMSGYLGDFPLWVLINSWLRFSDRNINLKIHSLQ